MRTCLYHVPTVVKFLLDPSKSLYLRAIRLYELQVAITFGQKMNVRRSKKKPVAEEWLAIPNDVLASACVCSALKLLQYIQQTKPFDKKALRSLLRDRDARDILSHVLKTPKDLTKFATALRPRNLNVRLRNRYRRQARYAPLYDVSLRFERVPGSKLKGGFSTAVRLLSHSKSSPEYAEVRSHYPRLKQKTAVNKYKDEGNFLAAFVWLNHFAGGYFKAPQVKAAKFAENLLKKADNIQELSDFFGRYVFVKTRMEQKGYKLLELGLPLAAVPIEEAIRPLPEEILQAIL